MQNKLPTLLRCAAMGSCLLVVTNLCGQDWPYWRGPSFDGKSHEVGLPESWNNKGGVGSHLVWKQKDLGGRCTPTVLDGNLYLNLRSKQGTRLEGERVVCVDAKTGKLKWENGFNVWLSDVPDTRVGWSSVVADPETKNVYSLGACGYFQCLAGETGETLWSIPLHEQFGLLSTYGGRTNHPILCDDLVIISGIIINYADAAKPNHRFIALDKRTGVVKWFSGTRDFPKDTTYSGPSLATIDGQKQLIVGAGDGAIWGFQPRTGKPLWNYQLSRRGIFATPLVVGNRVYTSHSEENPTGSTMGALAAIEISGIGNQTQVKELWKNEGMVIGRSAPVLVKDRLYVVDDRCKLYVVDADSGQLIAERIRLGDSRQFSSLLFADGKFYVLTENGRWAVLKPTSEGAEIVARGRLRNESFYGSPIACNGCLYFPGRSALYCVGQPRKGTQVKELPKSSEEMAPNSTPAWIQITPSETTLRPGEKLPLQTTLFNPLGQPLQGKVNVSYHVDGVGSIQDSTYVAPEKPGHHAVKITASVGNLTGTARLRIIPEFPWKFDFNDLDAPPVTWIGARYRHVIRVVDGSPCLVKVTTIPKGARSRCWMGQSDLKNYTIVVDVKGQRRLNQLPDIGVIAQGYVLDMQGNSQRLQIRSWASQLRMAQTIDFPWQEDVWYRMKLQTEVDDSVVNQPVAVLRGKVWRRAAEEPKEWLIEARDESPNLSGSPGLYGNAKVAEIYIDNLEVIASE